MDDNKENILENEQSVLSENTEDEENVCANCGAVMEADQQFCHKCGSPKQLVQHCIKCGADLTPDQVFCPRCGHRVGELLPYKEEETHVSSAPAAKQKKKNVVMIAVISAAVLVVCLVVGILILPGLLTDTAGYIEKGDLEKAWSKAKTEEEKILVADAYLRDGDYQHGYEAAPNEEKQLEAIVAALDAGDTQWAESKAESDEVKTLVADAYLRDGDYQHGYEAAPNEEKQLEAIVAALDAGDTQWAESKAESDEVKILVSNAYLKEGNYQAAYDLAPEEQAKFLVKIENIAAVQSAFSSDNLKDPSSFELRDVYYSEAKKDDGGMNAQLVLYISGANSYGAKVSSYWLYTWNNDYQEWDYFTSVSDLTDDEYKSYDTDDDRLEKLIDNIGRSSIRNTMSGGTKLSKDAVSRINALFEQDKLSDVVLLNMMINQA